MPSPPSGLFLQIVQSDYGFISAQTAPGARCSAHGTLPNGSNIGGIHNPQVAAGDGTVSWNYPQPATTVGNGVHVVSCSQGGMTSTASANFQVGA